MKKQSKRACRPFPDAIFVTRLDAGTEDEFYVADEAVDGAVNNIDGTEKEQRVAVYELVRVLLPKAGIQYAEVENDDGRSK